MQFSHCLSEHASHSILLLRFAGELSASCNYLVLPGFTILPLFLGQLALQHFGGHVFPCLASPSCLACLAPICCCQPTRRCLLLYRHLTTRCGLLAGSRLKHNAAALPAQLLVCVPAEHGARFARTHYARYPTLTCSAVRSTDISAADVCGSTLPRHRVLRAFNATLLYASVIADSATIAGDLVQRYNPPHLLAYLFVILRQFC